MRREGYWGTNLELLAFSDLMRLNINIYNSLDQDTPEFQINHPQNTGEINIFLIKLETLWMLAITWWTKWNSDK